MQSETKLDTKLIQADGDISVEDQELIFDSIILLIKK